jgi:hypothetical protein
MPIRPIDLQTMLMQMSQVGRDQAVEKDGPALQSAIQGAVMQKKAIESKESVRRAEESKEGAEPVKDRRGRGSKREARASEGSPEGSPEGEEGAAGEEEKGSDEEVVRDPSLGNRVDLTG